MTCVEDKKVEINNHCYFDPHKWIVCLVGSGQYPINLFLESHMNKLEKAANLSVSVMALSSDPLPLNK